MTRRALYMHVSPDVPQALAYGAYDPASIAAAGKIALSNANLTALYNGAAAGFAGVRGTIPMTSGRWYWETRSENTTALNYGFTGIIRGDQAANAGTATTLCMAHQGNGTFSFNGVSTVSVGATAAGARIQHLFDADAGIYYVGKNAGWLVAASGIVVGPGWYPVMQAQIPAYGWTLCPGGPSGLSPHIWTRPSNTKVYATQPAPVATLMRMATRAITTPDYLFGVPPDPLAFYDGRISARSDIQLARNVVVWPWAGSGGSAPALGQLELLNKDGALNVWRDYGWRDKVASLYYSDGDLPGTIGPGTAWAFALVDRLEFRGDIVRMVFGDWMAKLQRSAQSQNYRKQSDSGLYLLRNITTDVGEEVEGKALPLLIGTAYQAEPFNVNPAPGVREYQFSDSPLYTMLTYDKCDPFDELPTGLDIIRPSRSDGFRMAPSLAGPLGKVTGDVVGPFYRLTQRVTTANGGGFTTWTGDNPDGWTVTTTETAACRFTQNGAACRIQSNGTSRQSMSHNASNGAWTVGRVIEVQFTVTAVVTPGPIFFLLTSGLNTSVRRVPIYGTGTYRVVLSLPAGATAYTFWINSGLNVVAGDTVDVTIDNLEAWEVLPITRWADVVQYLITTRGGFLLGDVDATTLASVSSNSGNPVLGYYSNNGGNIDEILRQCMDAVTGFVFVDRLAKFRFGRLDVVDKEGPVLALTGRDLMGEIVCELDVARGLSTNMAGMRNWSPTDADSMATSVTALDKRKWSERFQAIKSALGVVHSSYAHADNAKPRETILQVANEIKAEVSRMATLYSVPRYFYRCTVSLDLAAANALNPGDVVSLTVDTYDLSNGKNLMVVGIVQRFFSQAVDLVLWG